MRHVKIFLFWPGMTLAKDYWKQYLLSTFFIPVVYHSYKICIRYEKCWNWRVNSVKRRRGRASRGQISTLESNLTPSPPRPYHTSILFLPAPLQNASIINETNSTPLQADGTCSEEFWCQFRSSLHMDKQNELWSFVRQIMIDGLGYQSLSSECKYESVTNLLTYQFTGVVAGDGERGWVESIMMHHNVENSCWSQHKGFDTDNKNICQWLKKCHIVTLRIEELCFAD